MDYLAQNSDGTMPKPADFSKTAQEKHADLEYERLAVQIKMSLPTVRELIADLDTLRKSGAVPGDILYCPHRLGEPALAWKLVDPITGEGKLLGSEKAEDLEWYMHFGPLELLGK